MDTVLNITGGMLDRPSSFPGRIAFDMFGAPVYWYAIFVISGFFVSLIIALLWCHYKFKLPCEPIYYFFLGLLPVALCCARFWSALIGDLEWKHLFSVSGGLAIQGGILGSIAYAMIFFTWILKKPKYHVRVEFEGKATVQKPSLWIYVDIMLPTVLIGQAIGRWGNFFNGEIYGAPANLDWLENIMPGVVEGMTDVKTGKTYAPLFLYESFTNVMVFIPIYFGIPFIKKIRVGVQGACYIVAYGTFRMVFESMRASQFAFATTYVTCAFFIIFGLSVLLYAQLVAPRLRGTRVWFKIRTWIKFYFKNPKEIAHMKNNKKFNELYPPKTFIVPIGDTIYYDGR